MAMSLVTGLLLPYLCGAAVVGVVTVSEGESHLVREGGYYAVEQGMNIEEGDILQTADDAAVQLEMDDESVLDIGRSSEFYIDEYVLAGDASVETAKVSLIKGWLRFVTTKLRRTSRYEINMPVATIGIRGTEGVLSTDDQSSSLSLNEGEVEVFELDDAGELGAAASVRAGDFVRRERGRRLVRLDAVPETFAQRMPGRFKRPPQRFKSSLSQRGVKAKKIRAVRDEDFQRLLQSNPRIHKKFKERDVQKNRQSNKKIDRIPRNGATKFPKQKGAGKSTARTDKKPRRKQ